jgi:hypothetical protein
MSKESILSIVRIGLTSVGAYLAGKSFLGATIDDNLWLGIVASVVTASSIVWGIVDKSLKTEMLASGLRSIVLTFGTLLVGSGIIKDDILQAALGIISIAIPAGLSETDKRTNKNVAVGKVPIADLSGVNPEKIAITPDTTPIETKKLNNLNTPQN